MLLYNGEIGEPCGTPTFVGLTWPLSYTPTFSVCLISLRRLPSAIRLAISVRSLRCGMLVKYALKSISTTPQARLYRSSRAAKLHGGLEAADWASQRDLIRALVKRVEVARNDVNIVFRIDPYQGDNDPEKKVCNFVGGVVAPILAN